MSGDIAARLESVRASIRDAGERAGREDSVTLVAVSKTVPAHAVLDAYQAGQRTFGENRVQEAVKKQSEIADRAPHADWHLIGHLQTNKVKTAVEAFSLLESVDSLRLAEHVDRHASRLGTKVPVLYEVNIAEETSKGGFTTVDLEESLPALLALGNIDPRGLMTVAPLAEHAPDVRPVFRRLRLLRDRIRDRFELNSFVELSMGMSNDYVEAIAEGATIVRIGRAIFGDRPG